MVRKAVVMLVGCTIVLAASACNTVRGVGQDLESAADTVDRAT